MAPRPPSVPAATCTTTSVETAPPANSAVYKLVQRPGAARRGWSKVSFGGAEHRSIFHK